MSVTLLRMNRLLPILAFLTCAVARQHATDQPADLFTAKIEPILREHCFKCHSHASDKIKGGLVLDSAAGAFGGGDTGPAIVPHDVGKSLLIEAVSYTSADLQMPPKGKRLSGEQVALLTEWVKNGAPWPRAESETLVARPKGQITEEDRRWWSFQPLGRAPAALADEAGARNEIDGFIFAKLRAGGLEPAPPAFPEQLARRLFFDLTGLPPSPEEMAGFVEKWSSAAASERPAEVASLVERLLASPRYGEQWARHWFDLVRYAESDGFKADDYRPNAWRYRDYVIDAFNRDKPYDRFVQEQLAGDELFPHDLDALVATGFLRLGIYEYNNRDAPAQWANILNDLTDVTADVFLGLGVQCARCHDHKFDPILQKDYYRLQAFFAPLLPRDDVPLATPEEQKTHAAAMQQWEEQTAELRTRIAEIEEPAKTKATDEILAKFPAETRALLGKPRAERTAWEHQIAELAWRQVLYEWDRLGGRLGAEQKEKLASLRKELAAFPKPAALPEVLCVSDVGLNPPATVIPKKAGEILPGFLTLLDEQPATIERMLPGSTGRRATLARWLTRADHPLTARVMVNRIWQHHFGRGLVATASDFGKLGEQPSHPELLDWLARRFISDGWSVKKLHRLILASATYQQSIENPLGARGRLKDPENRLLWRANSRRLSAEQIRDATLAITGELKLDAGGPSSDWSAPRRTIYTKVRRNTHDPLLEVFDAPEGFSSVSERNVTTTSTQALHMINAPSSLARARAFAKRLEDDNSSDEGELISDAYRRAFSREPSAAEIVNARTFLARHATLVASIGEPRSAALADLCHVLLNSNEFLYVD